MKINVLGNIIETKGIISISPISSPCGHLEFDDSGDSGDNEDDWVERFYINLPDKRSIRISAIDSDQRYYNPKQFKELRNKVIEAWNSDREEILEIK